MYVDNSKLRCEAIRTLCGEIVVRIMSIMLSPLDKWPGMCYAELNSARRGTPPPSSVFARSRIQMS